MHVELTRKKSPGDFHHVIINEQIEEFVAASDWETMASVVGGGHNSSLRQSCSPSTEVMHCEHRSLLKNNFDRGRSTSTVPALT